MKPIRVPPLITLTTDFGLTDHYVGAMKGVLLSLCPEAQLVDISHEIAPFSVYSGAYAIDQVAPFFPPQTIHLVIVDPGVGTSRKPVLVEAIEQYFIGPDNGVLSLIAERDHTMKAREITNRELWLQSPSNTFHGRDVFAPVAGALASGVAKTEDAGPPLDDIQRLPGLVPEQFAHAAWRGRLLSIDRFGNAITNFKSSEFAAVKSRKFGLSIGRHKVSMFQETFGAAPPRACFVYFGSSGYLEIGMNQESAASHLNASPGDPVILRM